MDDTTDVIALRAGRRADSASRRASAGRSRITTGSTERAHDWLRPAAARRSRGANGRSARLLSPGAVLESRFATAGSRSAGATVALPLNQWPQPHAEHGHGWQARMERRRRAPTTGWRSSTITRPDAWPFPYRARQEFLLTGDDAQRDAVDRESRAAKRCPPGWAFIPISRAPRDAGCRRGSTRCGRPTTR